MQKILFDFLNRQEKYWNSPGPGTCLVCNQLIEFVFQNLPHQSVAHLRSTRQGTAMSALVHSVNQYLVKPNVHGIQTQSAAFSESTCLYPTLFHS